MTQISSASRILSSGERTLKKWEKLRDFGVKTLVTMKRYVKPIATVVAPPMLPEKSIPSIRNRFVKLIIVDSVIAKFLGIARERNTHHVVVTGMGRAEKSLTASAVVRDKGLRRHFKHGVLWIDDEAHDYNERAFLLNLNALALQFQDVVLSRFHREGRASQYERVTFKTVQDAQEYFLKWQKKYSLKCLLVVDSSWNFFEHRISSVVVVFGVWALFQLGFI